MRGGKIPGGLHRGCFWLWLSDAKIWVMDAVSLRFASRALVMIKVRTFPTFWMIVSARISYLPGAMNVLVDDGGNDSESNKILMQNF